MRNPITMAKDAVGGWIADQSPSSLGGIAFGLLTAGGLALIALGGHIDASAVVDEVLNSNDDKNEEGSGEDPSAKKDDVIDITDQAIVE